MDNWLRVCINIMWVSVVIGKQRLPLCASKFKVAYQELPPYTEFVNNSARGILFDILKLGMQHCCTKVDANPIKYEVSILEDVNHYMDDSPSKEEIDFIIPVQRTGETRTFLGHPYVPMLPSPGLALFIRPPPNSLTILINALKPVLPLLTVSVLAVAIAGVVFWMIENMTIAWKGFPPQRFHPGVWYGMWWAFIAMTTIGYGEIVPRTNPGRIFAVVWVLAGIVLCGSVVSMIASALISALSPKPLSLMNQRVAVLHGSEAYKYVFKKQGSPQEFESIEEISWALQNGNVSMAILDILVASRYKKYFKGFILDRVIEHVTNNGIAFCHRSNQHAVCFDQFILDSQREITRNISNMLQGTAYKSRVKVSSSSIINPTAAEVQYTLVGITLLVMLLFIFGLIKGRFEESRHIIETNTTKGTLLKYKKEYRTQLVNLIDSLKTQLEHEGLGDNSTAMVKNALPWNETQV